jgi:hypothetical protein
LLVGVCVFFSQDGVVNQGVICAAEAVSF